ncbi:MAG: tRNA guanosine(34) transglycosylase Tgt [Firmicutes bacterium]|nr:tRNA guanosine(34) transglycosylase Tgt [Bacillota bacterium]
MSTNSALTFKISHTSQDSAARTGCLFTPHGVIRTPVFMPVGTQATVKAVKPQELEELGAEILLSNTYHLMLRPGEEIVAQAGGLHRFMAWEHPILTDSGGFQVMSLAALRRISDEGVAFRSHLSGEALFLSPERAIEIENALGADIIMALDECPPYPCSPTEARTSAERTLRWAQRSLRAHQRRADQALFGITQGSIYPEVRRFSAQETAALPFDGYAIGGLSVGEPKACFGPLLDETLPWLPGDKPRYVMGVGTPDLILEGVLRGVDMFDCVYPTRIARNGSAMSRYGRLNLRNARWEREFGPMDPECDCFVCRTFSAAYLHHLVVCKEILGAELLSYHNLYFLTHFMAELRKAIEADRLLLFAQAFLETYHQGLS